MDWWRDNFWIILAVAIVLVSTSLGLILYCACRQLLRQGNGSPTWAGGGRGGLGCVSMHHCSYRAGRFIPGLYELNFGLSIMPLWASVSPSVRSTIDTLATMIPSLRSSSEFARTTAVLARGSWHPENIHKQLPGGFTLTLDNPQVGFHFAVHLPRHEILDPMVCFLETVSPPMTQGG